MQKEGVLKNNTNVTSEQGKSDSKMYKYRSILLVEIMRTLILRPFLSNHPCFQDF